MGEIVAGLRLALAAALLTAAAGCSSLGDFGRANPDPLADAVSQTTTSLGGYSVLNQTDDEREMHDRVWAFLVAPYARDWAFEYGSEIKPRPGDSRPKGIDRYFRWLKAEPMASPHTRYSAVGDHAGADIDALPATFRAICAVEEVDRQRGVAAGSIDGIEPKLVAAQQKRQAANRDDVDRFVLALDYRYQSYSYALDRLLVDTPHKDAVDVDTRLTDLAGWVDRARSGDFCADGGSRGGRGTAGLPSRTLMDAPDEGEFRK